MHKEDIQTELKSIADEFDVGVDDVESLYESRLEHFSDVDVINVDEADYPAEALATVRSHYFAQSRTASGSRETLEIPILAIGHFGTFNDWGRDNDTVLVAVGVAAPPDSPDENRPAGLCVFLLSEARGIDIGRAREMWQWGAQLNGWFALERLTESFAGRSRTYYVANSTDRSKLEEATFDTLPDNPAAVQELLAENFIPESFELADINPESLAEVLSVEGEEFGSNWLDLRRYRGRVVDSFRRLPEECEPDENPFGVYRMIDDSVAVGGLNELESNELLYSNTDSENSRTPGLQVIVPPESVQWGEDSTLELYGIVRQNSETGQVTMRAAGIAPIIPVPYPENGGGDHDDVEQTEL